MRAMVLDGVGKNLVLRDIPKPKPDDYQVLIKVSVCAICRTDLHIIDGDLSSASFPLVLGHQVVGYVEEVGKSVGSVKVGDRVGVPWLGSSCGKCFFCDAGQENLCSKALYTGYQINGGLAQYCIANGDFVFHLPSEYSDSHVAPLLCAGLIGYRALKMTSFAKNIGFFGFGSSAHILIQVVRHMGGNVYAFTKKGDLEKQRSADRLGAIWSGGSDERPPSMLDAVIIFAADGSLIPKALDIVRAGGVVVCAEIHMSDIPSFPYEILWNEKVLRSVANLTRADGREFFSLLSSCRINTEIKNYSLEDTNRAITDLRCGLISGSAVIEV